MTTKKATKKAAKKKDRVTSDELKAQILKFMTKGKDYSSREIVEGLGRKPGSVEGGPVVRSLHALVTEKKVKSVSIEGKLGLGWQKL